jgi:hypothetical protein
MPKTEKKQKLGKLKSFPTTPSLSVLISSSVLYLYLHTLSVFGEQKVNFENLIIKINDSTSNMWYEMQTKNRINEHAAVGMERFALLCR